MEYIKVLFIAVTCVGAMVQLLEATEGQQYGVKGVPDDRKLKMKISRGSGTGPISAEYTFICLCALALFAGLIYVILCYKRETGIRGEERTLFYA